MNTPPIPTVRQSIQRRRVKEIPTRTTLGSRHRPKRGSALNTHQSKHSIIPDRTRRTQSVPQGTPGQRNDTTVKEPLCRRLLLHQKEEWEAMTCTRLQTR